jgi:predicted nucleotidyltransferase
MSHENFLAEFKKNHPDREIIFLMVAGSHFFDLNGPTSDHDYRGIYLPSLQEFYEGEGKRKMSEYKTKEGNVLNNKNTAEDTDFTMYSITKFLELLAAGDFNMMEILHAPEDKILIDSDYMKELRAMRKSLLVNDISAFLGFIKKEYRRYGVNIHHYEQQEKLMKFMMNYQDHTRLYEIWNDILEYAKDKDFITFTETRSGHDKMLPTLKIAQRAFQNTVTAGHVVDAIRNKLETYGHRQKNMAASGVEFKGLYHAQRLIYEANDLLDFGELQIPLSPERLAYLRAIKEGTADQDTIFANIDNDIDALFAREKAATFNKPQVAALVEKLLFKLHGQKRVEYLTNKQGFRI